MPRLGQKCVIEDCDGLIKNCTVDSYKSKLEPYICNVFARCGITNDTYENICQAGLSTTLMYPVFTRECQNLSILVVVEENRQLSLPTWRLSSCLRTVRLKSCCTTRTRRIERRQTFKSHTLTLIIRRFYKNLGRYPLIIMLISILIMLILVLVLAYNAYKKRCLGMLRTCMFDISFRV